MTKTLYRIHWKNTFTGVMGTDGELYDRKLAQQIVDGKNLDPYFRETLFWIEPETVEDETEAQS